MNEPTVYGLPYNWLMGKYWHLTKYASFSGTDMVVSLVFPQCTPIVVGSANTVTYSIYRSVKPVTTLGRISMRGLAKGTRVVAGTIIFTMLDQNMVNNLKDRIEYLRGITRLKPDELPPFDIVITAANEYGHVGRMTIYGATVYEDGQTMSIQDMFTENVWSYQARDVMPFGSPLLPIYDEINWDRVSPEPPTSRFLLDLPVRP